MFMICVSLETRINTLQMPYNRTMSPYYMVKLKQHETADHFMQCILSNRLFVRFSGVWLGYGLRTLFPRITISRERDTISWERNTFSFPQNSYFVPTK